MKRRVWKIGLWVLAAWIALTATGVFYQWYCAVQDRRTYQPVGRLYDVKGNKMHLYSDGEGETTVVFASGWGTPNPYADFSLLYEGLKQHVKIAVYDRFGYGYSDVTGKERNIDEITSEIHELLQVSGQKPPYVFVGHSLGALETIRYAQRYPGEVKGILMIEGGSPEYYAHSPELMFIPILYKGLRATGVLRALYHLDAFKKWAASDSNEERLLPEAQRTLNRKSMLLLAGNRDMVDEIRQSQENAQIVLAGEKPLPLPISVLTADYFGKLAEDRAWMDSQAELTSWSVDGKQIIVKDSSHYVHSYQPDRIVRELLQLIGNADSGSED
ncbi:putative aminoacrylate hydrolase RutD [compost metagenome]